MGRGGEALPLYEEALAMRRRLHKDEDHADLAAAMNNVGRLKSIAGQNAEAEGLLREAVSMYGRLRQGDHRNTADAMANLAQCLSAEGKHAEAVDLAEQAAAMAARATAAGSPLRRKCDQILKDARRKADQQP